MRELTALLYPALELIRTAINVFGVLVVAWGVAEAVWGFVRLRTVEHSHGLFVRASSIRERLGVHLLLALDIFIGADLIATALHPDWRNVAILAAIVAIRVVLSILLAREIADAHQFIERNTHRREEVRLETERRRAGGERDGRPE